MYEELLKELDNIYDSEKTKEVLKNYMTYIDLRKDKKVKFGTYNIYIRNKSKQRIQKELIQLVCKILKEKGIINTSYKYLEREIKNGIETEILKRQKVLKNINILKM